MEKQKSKATFGAGCFWGVEEKFRNVEGVVKTTVGYMGGDDEKYPDPTYEEVSSDKTGFIEVCNIEFDPDRVSYEKLLEAFWKIHNPTQLNRQGPDVGTQYKSVIFYYDAEQKELAEKSKEEEQKKYGGKIVTEIREAEKFHPAEEYHQKYLMKKGLKTCRI